jgi:hypothetical protein
MPEVLLIASVGWYERRLLKSIGKSGADSVYLIRGTGGKIAEVTTEFAKRVKQRLVHMEINIDEEADFDDHTRVLTAYVRIIEKTLKKDKDARIIIDITSTTKDGALAAFLVGKLYDIEISYVPELRKFGWMEDMDTKDVVARFDKDVAKDPGKEYRSYKLKSLDFPESWKTALVTIDECEKIGMGEAIDRVGKALGEKRRRAAYQRYWGRVFHRLQDEGFIEITKSDNGIVTVRLSDIGKAFVNGLKLR